MAEIGQAKWNALAQDEVPFMRWEWLNLLETSGCVSRATGWLPAHLIVRREDRLVGAAPLYLKGHGAGEFIYDLLWADVAQGMGLKYYPKLVAANPFTPVQGYRFLVAPDQDRAALTRAMLGAVERLCLANSLSGCTGLFVDQGAWEDFQAAGYHGWAHQGFIWKNKGYGSFEDFLACFRSNRRKNIRRERRLLEQAKVKVEVVPGEQAPNDWFPLMHRYYLSTSDKFGEYGCRYLNFEFFQGLSQVFRPHLVFSAAFKPGVREPVGLAMLVKGPRALYGRYWGAGQDVPFMHFELCYYAPLSLAIEAGLESFDPGMGGEHKPGRGFSSRTTMSLHRFTEPSLEAVFAHHIREINQLEMMHIAELNELVPLKPECLP